MSTILAVSWCCQSSTAPWTWEPRTYLGVWVVLFLLAAPYVASMRARHRSVGLDDRDRRAMMWYALGLAGVWASSDWPLGSLGAGYLLSIHTVLYIIFTMVAAPLMLLGMPRWMFDNLLDRLRLRSLYRAMVRPWVAGIVLNLILVVTHIPMFVDALRTSQFGSFVLDAAWLLSGIVGWLPIISPREEDRIGNPMWKVTYLFLAFGAFPMVPGAFITFAGQPLYGIYDLAPRFGDWSTLEDQQLGGAIMKVGNIPILWAVIAAIFVRSALKTRIDERNIVPDDTEELIRT